MDPVFGLFFFEELPEGTTSIHLLEKAGDVVFAAGGPGEGVGVGCYVGGHQLGRLVAFGTAGIADPVVVHPKTERHNITQDREVSALFVSCTLCCKDCSLQQEAQRRGGTKTDPPGTLLELPTHFRGQFQLGFKKKRVISQREMSF